MLSTPRILRQPAMAVWVWSRISLSSEIGVRSRFTRKMNPMRSLRSRPHAGPFVAPTATMAPRAQAPKKSATGNMMANHFAARSCALYCVVMAAVSRARVRSSSPYAWMTGAPLTSSDTSERLPPTAVRTSS